MRLSKLLLLILLSWPSPGMAQSTLPQLQGASCMYAAKLHADMIGGCEIMNGEPVRVKPWWEVNVADPSKETTIHCYYAIGAGQRLPEKLDKMCEPITGRVAKVIHYCEMGQYTQALTYAKYARNAMEDHNDLLVTYRYPVQQMPQWLIQEDVDYWMLEDSVVFHSLTTAKKYHYETARLLTPMTQEQFLGRIAVGLYGTETGIYHLPVEPNAITILHDLYERIWIAENALNGTVCDQ